MAAGQPQNVVIVGSGQAGYQAAASLRENGFQGPVTIVGDEPGLPYQRPPLSKAYLTGKTDEEGLLLRARPFFDDRGIDVLAPERAARIERAERRLVLGSGLSLPYGHLVLATGARNRPLAVPGADLDGVLYLRTRADADRLRAQMSEARRIVVIGAGFIGLEFAAVAAARGVEVTVLEAASRPMSRALSLPMSDFFREAHEAAGLRLVFGAVVTRIEGRGGRAVAVETAAGEMYPCDLVLVGIGVMPNAELAAEAGLAIGNGIVVDAHLLTADPAISAIGDCAAYPSPHAGGRASRLESVQNAVDQARAVAARLTGSPAPYAAVPWFWSDQGSLKLQIAGLAVPHEETIIRGDPASGAFSVFCYEGERLLGVESVNRPADHMIARRLLAAGLGVTREEAADPGLDLKARASALLTR
ncbi:NAD(P)/FAD-dependent oxidoreductase [Enterovirga rhinocerotis]|uniref:3-phenylpropionate/trans-cinnamate dioxygenase ferredoxin reductase subunit n=1 Tax=Enterovirga rhinocerotis TaxID=1339210 RepID=A0A4R7BW38_9HYPH|nr:FAD-dependent oxidoreductase [Enterovirga rhinocerotis]TDR90098.1 3-phenylpropionate/trans-cinnamate dioxygenase ferredoxin reductase subunit [Enterovirga rhinocerotis]